MAPETISKAPQGGEFIIRDIEASRVFIPEDFTEEQKMMAQSTTEFIEKEVAPQRERFEKKDYAWTEELLKKAGELGLLGISLPEEYGGLDMGFNTSMLVCDRISGISGSLSTAYGAHTGIGTLPILLYGSQEQRDKYLPKLATGEMMGAYCLTEPGAGSDANSGKTKAEPIEGGKKFKINGQKIWISNAGFADVFTVFARIEDDQYLTGFIVERGTEGMTFGEEEHKMGIHSSSTRQVFFNDCIIPAENLLGERNGGFKIAMNALNYGRIKLGVACLDASRRTLGESVRYAKERKQFDTPIAEFGAIQKKIGEMTLRTWIAESAIYRAGQDIEDNIQHLIDEGMEEDKAKLKGAEEYAIECAILKIFGSEVGSYTADEGVQIFGGMGYSADYSMEAGYRDIRIARIYEGTNEINRMHSVGMLLKRALKGEIDLMSPAQKVADELMDIPDFGSSEEEGLLTAEKELLQRLKKSFLMVAGKAVQEYAQEIDQEQELLMNAADMLMEIYVAESGLLRAEKLAQQDGENQAALPLLMARLYLQQAAEKVGLSGREAIYSFTEGDEQRMLLMGLKRFTKVQEPLNVKEARRTIAAHIIEKEKYPFA